MNEQQVRLRAATFVDRIKPTDATYRRWDQLMNTPDWQDAYVQGKRDSTEWRRINE